MCIIAICENRKLTNEEFTNCWNSNTHGFGCATWNGKSVSFGKGIMDIEGARAVYENLSLPHVVHFRIASAGGVSPELTHPFLVSPDSPIVLTGETGGEVLFHNGTLIDYKTLLTIMLMLNQKMPEGPVSDTRVFAMALSRAGDGLFQLYDSQRFVVVSPQGVRKYGDWDEHDGVLFSNSTYKSSVVYSAYQNFDGYWYKGEYRKFQSAGGPIKSNPGTTYARRCTDCSWYVSPMYCYLRGNLKDTWACKQYTEEEVIFPDDKVETLTGVGDNSRKGLPAVEATAKTGFLGRVIKRSRSGKGARKKH